MFITDVIKALENLASPSLQEEYDNVGLLVGNQYWECNGLICCLDVTEKVVAEAVQKKCNLIVAHHPIIFSGLKKINGTNYVQKTIIAAIKNNIAIYAIHTNLDNILTGVNKKMADVLGLQNTKILMPKPKQLQKLYTYVPVQFVEKIKAALFDVGAGQIGNYSQCSFTIIGEGNFKGNNLSKPVIGKKNTRTSVQECKVEIIFPAWLQSKVITTLKNNHPYEEVAYEIITLENIHQEIGSGLIGILPKALTEKDFLALLKRTFRLPIIRHTNFTKKKVQKVALCGGSGSFLTKNAISAGADAYITADVKYHEFFDANDALLLTDIGHWESEQFTINIIFDYLKENFTNFAILKTKIRTNSVYYYT